MLTWFDRTGKVLGHVGEPGLYTNVALSPDDKRIAVSLTTGTPANRDIYILDAATGATTRVTEHSAVDASPIWSPDGTKIAFSSQRDGPYQIYVRDLAKGTDELVFKGDGPTIATSWSTERNAIGYVQGSRMGLWSFRPQPLRSELIGDGDNLVLSPANPMMAYQSSRSGRTEIYSVGADTSNQVSRSGGTQPLWSGDGKELFFFAPDGSVMSSVSGAAPTKLFSAPISLVIRRSYAVTSDGQRILMPILDDRVAQTIAVLPKWTASRSR